MLNARLKFCGGARTVTGSSHLIKTDQSRVLIDAGLFQGRRKDFYDINNYFSFDPIQLSALVLSHAHIDHSGNIPNLVKHGMRAPIYATSATTDLCRLMLPDSGHIQEEDVKFVNKIHLRKGLPPVKPLYTQKDANKSLEYFRGHYYEEPVKISDDITCVFYEAGHVLGSAIPVLQMDGVRLAYAVDLGRKNLPLLRDPVIPKDIDYLIIESTYGSRRHDPIETAKAKLAEVINKTIKRGGKVIIPSFAFERTQEVVYFINELFVKGEIPMIPIYVDSPLATNITMAFQQNIRYLDEATQNMMRRQQDPFGFSRIRYVRSADESKKLNEDKQPMVILSASGMCEAGRILHHLKNNIENPNNTILVIGYMAENTLGKKIVERQPSVKIFGEEYRLRAEVVKINSFSAHADQDELVEFVSQCAPKKKIFIVHGDMNQAEPFLQQLKDLGLPAYLPAKNEEVALT
jgi:metallo-beta-lactamase family protein